MHQGLLNYFDNSENTFISAYREHSQGDKFKVKIEYMSSPEIEGRTVILCDPMLASGSSMVLAIKALLSIGNPKHIHIVVAIGSKDGVNYVQRNNPITNSTLWIGAIDSKMTSQSYIVPGLGDAGDLAFGKKI